MIHIGNIAALRLHKDTKLLEGAAICNGLFGHAATLIQILCALSGG